MQSEHPPLKVFICHASRDKAAVRELYRRLSAEGWIDPWLDEEKLLPGQDWDMEIEKAVEKSDAVIVCLSNHSVTKEGYVQRELKYVLDIALEKPEETIFVIPVRLNECELPRRLRAWQYVDYFPPDSRNRAYQRLVQSLKLRSGDSRPRKGFAEDAPSPPSGPGTEASNGTMSADAGLPERSVASPPSIKGVLAEGGSVLPVLFFALTGLYVLGYSDDAMMFLAGLSAVLTGALFMIRRRIIAHRLVKYATLAFTITHMLLIYSQLRGWDLSDPLSILDAIAAGVGGGARLLNLKAPDKAAPYASILLGSFILLFGIKLLLNLAGQFDPFIHTPMIVVGIAASIFLWLEQ